MYQIITSFAFYSFTAQFTNKRFFARICLYLLALVNYWGTRQATQTTQNYADLYIVLFLIGTLRSSSTLFLNWVYRN